MEQRIADPRALNALRDQARNEIDVRSDPKQLQITVHMGTCGIAAGARDVLATLVAELAKANLHDVTLRQSGCAGLCDQEPMLTLADKSGIYRYGKLDNAKIREILQAHVLGGTPVAQLLIQA